MIRAAINKSCVSDAANVICCLPPGITLDEIIEKVKWLYGSVESFDTLMQEFYWRAQGKNERVQAFFLCLEPTLKATKQQHPHTMTEQEGEHYLKDWLFHGLRSNIQNVLHYMYDKPHSHYSKFVMAARKAETETPGSGASEARANITCSWTGNTNKNNQFWAPIWGNYTTDCILHVFYCQSKCKK